MNRRIAYRFAISAATLLLGINAVAATSFASADESTAVEFVCVDGGAGLSAVDVLGATGEHGEFLRYFQEFDPEGYEILADPVLADKTVWAPTDAAFAALGDAPKGLPPEEIKAVLGFHISPPKRTPEGPYPIITFDYLAENGQVIFQTRTGILTDSDQRVRTAVDNGVYTVEGRVIGSTAWCTQAGSVFSIDGVITDVPVAGWAERTLGLAIYYAFFEYPYVTAIGTLIVTALIVWLIVRTVRSRGRAGESTSTE